MVLASELLKELKGIVYMPLRRLQNHDTDDGDNDSDAATGATGGSGLGLLIQGWSVSSRCL